MSVRANHAPVDEGRINRLTPTQRQCLRMVARLMTSKEIALELGIASDTVDKHLKAAIAILGARNRQQAARMFADYEQAQPPQQLGTQSPELVPRPSSGIANALSAGDAVKQNGAGQTELREGRSPFDAGVPVDRPRWLLPIPLDGRRGNHLKPVERLVWIFGIMVLIILSLALLASAAETIGRIASAVAADA